MVSRKMIIDHIQKNSLLPSTIELTNKLIKSVKCARQRHHFDLEEQRKKAKSDLRNQQLEILNAEMQDLTQRKQLLVYACENLDNEFIQVIREAGEKNDMRLVIKGNALKRKSEEKQSQVSALEDSLEILKEKRKKIM